MGYLAVAVGGEEGEVGGERKTARIEVLFESIAQEEEEGESLRAVGKAQL